MLDNKDTQLIEKEGKLYFFSPSLFESRCNQIKRLSELYRKVGDLLRKYDFPTKEDWQFAIVDGGSEALYKLVEQDAIDNARRLRVQRYLLDSFREIALSKIPKELTDELQFFPREISNAKEGLPILKKDISFKERTILIDENAIQERLREALTIEVPEKIIQEKEKIKEAILAVRELEESGLNARELVRYFVGEYLAPDDYPTIDDKTLLLKTYTRRHPTRQELLITSPDHVKQVESATRELIKSGLYGIKSTI